MDLEAALITMRALFPTVAVAVAAATVTETAATATVTVGADPTT